MSYTYDYATGELATKAFAGLVQKYDPESWIESKEGTLTDKKDGQDYVWHLSDGSERPGSHRHVKNAYRDYFCVRYSRANGWETDYSKLFKKPNNYLYSFSWGAIVAINRVRITTAGQFKQWIYDHEANLQDYLEDLYKDGNLFLKIPVNEVRSKVFPPNKE